VNLQLIADDTHGCALIYQMWKFSSRRKRDPTTDCDRFHESAVVLRTLLSPPQRIDHKPHLVQVVVPCSARREQMRVVAVSEVLLLYWPAVVPLYLKITCCCTAVITGAHWRSAVLTS